jgi:hypothetical protein
MMNKTWFSRSRIWSKISQLKKILEKNKLIHNSSVVKELKLEIQREDDGLLLEKIGFKG